MRSEWKEYKAEFFHIHLSIKDKLSREFKMSLASSVLGTVYSLSVNVSQKHYVHCTIMLNVDCQCVNHLGKKYIAHICLKFSRLQSMTVHPSQRVKEHNFLGRLWLLWKGMQRSTLPVNTASIVFSFLFFFIFHSY